MRKKLPTHSPWTAVHRLVRGVLTLIPATALLGLFSLAFAPAAITNANTSHAGWPRITGMLLMNKRDQSRPLDARPGHDPFDGTDLSYSCNGEQMTTNCFPRSWWHCKSEATAVQLSKPRVIPASADTASIRNQACGRNSHLVVIVGSHTGHNELLGGHGNNTIHAGPNGDVIWGDFKPSGDPTTQVDYLYGGPGNDIIYAAHGTNHIWTGGGTDLVHAHYGHGQVHCESATAHVILTHTSVHRYKLYGCKHISYN